MRILLDAIFIFIFVMILFYFKMPNIESDNYIKHKLLLFVFMMVFYYLLSVIRKLGNKKCTLDHYGIIKNSIKISLACVVGYSLYYDFLTMDWSKEYFTFDNEYGKQAVITLVIISLITILQCFESIFYNSEDSECINERKCVSQEN